MTVLNYKDSTGKYFSTTNNWWTIDGNVWVKGSNLNFTSFAIDKNGTLWSWGNNGTGKLGLNNLNNYASPQSVKGNKKTFCDISSGQYHVLSIDKYGQIWAWGSNQNGVLGTNSTITSKSTPVSILGNKKTFCKISAGTNHSLGLDYKGTAWAWGNGSNGLLGNNNTINIYTPVSVWQGNKTFCYISTNYNFSMTIDNNGMVWGWGENNYGQLGINSTVRVCVPVSILGDKKTFCHISTGLGHTIALDKNGLVWGWGINIYGRLGVNSTVSKLTPVSILGNKKTFCQISTFESSSLGLDKNGLIWGWGYNNYGQLGDNTFINKSTPVSILGNKKTFCQIFKYGNASVAIDKNGNIWGWGGNQYGVSSNYRGVYNYTTPNKIYPDKLRVYKLAAGPGHSIGLDYFGRIWSWGNNQGGQLGNNQNPMMRNTPVSLLGVNKTFCKISAGNLITLAIDKNGLTWAWGLNVNGVLGINSTTNKSTPTSILGNRKTFCKISVGNTSALVIDKNGQIWGWGYNLFGGLGDNSASNKSTPVSILGNKKTFCEISITYYHTISIDKGGQIWTWGYNNLGQLGINSTANRSTPVSILGDKKTFCKVSSGLFNSLGIDKSGQVWSWGYNVFGQLGNSSTTNRCTPVSIHGTKKTFCKITSGYYHTMAIDKNGQVWGWGYNLYGQLGIGTITSARTPVSILGNKKTFCDIFAKAHTTIAYDNYGYIWGWGLNSFGNITNNDGLIKITPVSIYNNNKTFCKISTGFNTSLSIDKNGLVWGWGYNNQGQIGDNSDTVRYTPVSILGTLKTFCNITGGRLSSGGIDKNGLVWGWGYNGVGMLGNNSTTAVRTPVSVLGNRKTFCQISFGYYTLMGIDKNGLVWGWGNNPYGQIGDSSITNRSTPVSILGARKTFCQISSGYWHSAAIDKNGRVWCWGSNNYGQIGDNTVTSRRTPVSILGATKTFCEIDTSFHHTLAIDKNGKVWGWGYNNYGQLGNNSLVSARTPVLIAGSKTFCQIRAGYMYSMALDNNNNIWSWGFNGNGQFGTVLNPNVSTPVVIGQNRCYCLISAGRDHSLSVDDDGLIWGWGNNSNGQIGDNSISGKLTPVSVLGNKKTFCQIGSGNNYTVAIDKNGNIWGWGVNQYGEVGNNSATSVRTPVSIHGTNKTFCQISAGLFTSSGIDKYGQVWNWGFNGNGQLGNNSTSDKCTPVSILGNKKTFCQIKSSTHSLGLDKYGQIWGWGYNKNGQLGNNSTSDKCTPVSILGNKKTFCQIGIGVKGNLSASFSAGIDYYGKVWVWGLVNDTSSTYFAFLNKKTPVQLTYSNKTFCQVSCGESNLLLIDKYNKTWSWGGSYDYGILGTEYIYPKTPILIGI